MDILYYQIGLTIIISFLLSACGLLFGQYKFNHTLLLKRPGYLIYYSLMYSVIAGGVVALLITDSVKINDFDTSQSPWLVALSIGVSAKSISKISLYTFKIDGKSISLGPKLIIDWFEEFLLVKIQDNIDEQLIVKITESSRKLRKGGRSLKEQNELIDRALPTGFTKIKRASYMKEISSLKKTYDKVRYFADKFGNQRVKMLNTIIQGEKEESAVPSTEYNKNRKTA